MGFLGDVGRDGPATNHELNPILLPRDDDENTMADRKKSDGKLGCRFFAERGMGPIRMVCFAPALVDLLMFDSFCGLSFNPAFLLSRVSSFVRLYLSYLQATAPVGP